MLALAGAVLLLTGHAPAASARFPDPVAEPLPVLPLPPDDEGCVLPISSLQPCADAPRHQPESCVIPVSRAPRVVPEADCPVPRQQPEGEIVPLGRLLVERGVVHDAPAQRP